MLSQPTHFKNNPYKTPIHFISFLLKIPLRKRSEKSATSRVTTTTTIITTRNICSTAIIQQLPDLPQLRYRLRARKQLKRTYEEVNTSSSSSTPNYYIQNEDVKRTKSSEDEHISVGSSPEYIQQSNSPPENNFTTAHDEPVASTSNAVQLSPLSPEPDIQDRTVNNPFLFHLN